MSLTSGSDILPSGLTGTVRHKSGQFFHTVMSRTSSGPIRYSFDMSTALALRTTGATRGAGAGLGAGAAGAVAASTAGVTAAAAAAAAVVAVTSAADGVPGGASWACATDATH